MRELKKWPTKGEVVVRHNKDKNFPDDHAFYRHFGTKAAMAEKILEYATKNRYSQIIKICNEVIKQAISSPSDFPVNVSFGWVYLAKSGPDYKIGHTNDIARRSGEIGSKLPNGYELIHKIKTVDPDGIENYWHQRFALKLKRGEWFNLTRADVNEFKRWRRIA